MLLLMLILRLMNASESQLLVAHGPLLCHLPQQPLELNICVAAEHICYRAQTFSYLAALFLAANIFGAVVIATCTHSKHYGQAL